MLREMLRTMLADRFGLKVHRMLRPGDGFALIVGKGGPKLTPASPPPAPAQALTEEEQKEQAAVEQKFQAGGAAMQKQMQEKATALGPLAPNRGDHCR